MTALRSPGDVCHMMNYTDRLTVLMQDVVSRVSALSFIDMGDVMVFARAGRSNASWAGASTRYPRSRRPWPARSTRLASSSTPPHRGWAGFAPPSGSRSIG